MSKLTNQQVVQIGNIFNTLAEAAEHLQSLVRGNEISKGLYSFSSIIEGYQAVSSILEQFEDEEIDKKKAQLDNNIVEMASFFEQGNLLKIDEILQFSFLPSIRKLCKSIAKKNIQTEKEDIIIGVFHSYGNPKDFYPEPRTMALVEESKKQQTKLLFFTSKDVDFENQQIEADMFESGEWKRVTSSFPDVVNNVGVGKRSQTERKLRRLIPFTSFHVGNKFSLPKRMLENRKFAELLVPFTVGMNKKQIHNFLEKNDKAVFKALKSNRGEDIYFVTKKGQRFIIAEHKKERIMARSDFDKWLDGIILEEKGGYIVQRFIQTRTKADEPYHFRAHVQKDRDGKWMLTYIYPRIGSKKSNLSNVATDGRIENFHDFMMKEFNENGPKYESDILRLSLEVAEHLDKLYGFSLDELGIDFAIDETGRYWMHEANNGPQTAFHEEKRAVNTIAYAKYIAENGIFYDETIRKSQGGLFQANKSQLPFHDTKGKLLIGIMAGKFLGDSLTKEIADQATQSGLSVCVFTPKSIDYDQMLIKAQVFENEQWNEKIVEYPQVIFDRIQMRNNVDVHWIYEELAEIRFINAWENSSSKKTWIFNKLKAFEDLQSVVVPFQLIEKTRDITRALETYGNVIIQRNDWSKNERIAIRTLCDGKYSLTEKGKSVRYNGLQLRNKLNEDLTKNTHIVQKDPRSEVNDKLFTIHTDLVLDTHKEFSIISLYASEEHGERTDANILLKAKYSEYILEELLQEAERISKIIAAGLYENYGESAAMVSLTLAIDSDNKLKLLGIGPNTVQEVYNPEAYAIAVVMRAKHLVTV